jgi:dTMP kinase
MSVAKLEQLECWVHESQPDLTLLFDANDCQNITLDRFEQEKDSFFEKVRQAYLDRRKKHPDRFVLINAAQSPEQVKANLEKTILLL